MSRSWLKFSPKSARHLPVSDSRIHYLRINVRLNFRIVENLQVVTYISPASSCRFTVRCKIRSFRNTFFWFWRNVKQEKIKVFQLNDSNVLNRIFCFKLLSLLNTGSYKTIKHFLSQKLYWWYFIVLIRGSFPLLSATAKFSSLKILLTAHLKLLENVVSFNY